MNGTEARDEVLQIVGTELPLLDERGVAQVVVSAVVPRTGRSTLAYLKDHHDWLTAGDPRLPKTALRLLVELRAVGAIEAVVPGCADCSLPRALTGRREDGSWICRPCASARSSETCDQCGRLRPVVARQADATALCDTCYQRPTTPCSGCGRDRPVKAHTADGPLCQGCYSRSPRTCGGCHQERQIVIKASGSHPDLCASCYNGPRKPCSRCGKIRTCRGVRTGTYLCLSCAPRPQAACARCTKIRDVKTRWPIGPVCSSCYGFIRKHPQPCPACGDHQPMIGATPDGSPRCGPCSGVDRRYACPRCGGPDSPGRPGACSRCQSADELRRHFGTSPLLASLIAGLEASERPDHVLQWLQRSDSSAALLRQLLASGHQPTHELLDAFPRRTAAVHLRQLLVTHQILPERNERLARAETWMHRLLADASLEHRHLLQPYTTWLILRRLRHRADTHGLTDSSVNYARDQARSALAFLRWLDEQSLTLDRAGQHDVDRWLTEGATTRLRLRDFLRWTARQKLSGELSVPAMPNSQAVVFLDEDLQVELLHRCVHDQGLPDDVRAAGALLLLFGAKLTRIARLPVQDFTQDGDQAFITFGGQPAPLPPAIARLLTTQAATRPRYLARHHIEALPQQWLFPGALPGRPVSAHRLGERLVAHGIEVRAARNTAVLSLVQDLPAPVVSELLDLHISTAVYWGKRGGRDWTGYLEARRTGATPGGLR